MSAPRARVLFLVPSLIGGGAQRVFSTLLQHLDRERFEIHLAVLQSAGPYMKDVPQDVTVHNLHVARMRYSLPAVIRIVRKLRPRTVICTLIYMNIVLLAAKPFLPKGIRIVIRESTMPGVFLREESKWPRLWEWAVRRLYRKADKVVCLSDAMAQELAENFGVPPERLARIYNPLDFEKVRKSADLGENPFCGPGPNLVTAGRLSREKGFDLLLQAMPTVISVLPKAKLLVLGEGPMQEELENQAKKLGLEGSVHLAGFQGNPWRYFRHADVFVMPSRYEGMPNALVEALAVGAQAVAADCPGAAREIEGCEGRLVLAATEDPVALAKAILYSCGRAMAAGHVWPEAESALRKFSLKEVVNQYAELL